ncbi:MAG: hypothetical protein V1934_06035 [Methanobacteriota archaeon]
MASSYLKAMQLRKQLEEKAKETAQLRQKAEDALSSAETLLGNAKAADLDTSAVNEIMNKAKMAMADKDYETALGQTSLFKEEVAKTYDKLIETICASTESLLSFLDEGAPEKKQVETLLVKAGDSRGAGDVEGALKHAKAAWEIAEKLMNGKLSAQFSAAQSLIVTARNSKEDVKEAEELLTMARSAMSSQDYTTAFEHVRKCIESTSGSLVEQINEDLDEARGLIATAKGLGIDTAKPEESLAKVEEQLDRYEFEGAMSSASLAKSEAEKALTRGISDVVERVSAEILSAEKIDAEVKLAQGHLTRAKSAIKGGNYEEAIGALKDGEEETKNAQFQRVLQTISQSKSKFMIAKKLDIDVSGPVDFLNKAKESMKSNDYKRALEFAEKGDDAIEQLVRDYQEADEAIKGLEQAVNDASESGIDAVAAAQTMAQAKETLEQKDYRKVALLVHKGLSEVEGLLYRMAMEHIEIAELVLNTGEKIGANMKEARDLFKESVDSMKAKKFKQAATSSDSCAARAEALIKDHVSGFIMTVELAIEQVEGIDPARPRELLSMAKQGFDQAEYDKSYELAHEAFSIVDSGQSRKARDELADMEKEILLTKEMGCTIEEMLRKLDSAKTAIADKNYAQVYNIYQDVSQTAKTLQYGAAEMAFSNAKLAVVEAKKLGIDITNMRETLKKAKSSFDLERYKETFDLSLASQNEASRMMSLRTEAYNTITQTAAMVAEAKKNNADVDKVMATLLGAKTAFERFDYKSSIDIANQARTETEALMNLYNSANLLMRFRDDIKLLQNLKVEGIEGYIKKAEDAKNFLKNKDYESAQSVLTVPAKEAREKLSATISSLISIGQSAVDAAKELRVRVDSAEAIISRSKTALAAEHFQEAVDNALEARNEVDRIRDLSLRAAKAVKEAHEKVSECENLRADPVSAKLKLEDAMESIKSSDYDKAIKLAQQAMEEATRSEHKYVAETINNFRLTIEKAKMDGTNVTAAERLLNQAREAMEAANLKKALELAMRSEGELEKMGLQQEMAAKAIRTAEDKFADANAQNIHSSAAAALIETAKAELRKGDYVRALEVAIQSGDELHRTKELFQEANESARMAREALALTGKMGADVSSLKQLSDALDSAMGSSDYHAADEKAKALQAEAKRVSHTHTSNRIVAAHNVLNIAGRLSINVPDAGTMLAQARSYLENGRFENAVELAGSAMDKTKSAIEGHARAALDETSAEMSHAVQLGGDISNAEKLFMRAKQALETGEFESAVKLAKEARTTIIIHKKMDTEFVVLSGEANKTITMAKKYGIPVREPEQLLSLAMAAKDSNYEQALKYAKEAAASSQKALEDFKPEISLNLSVQGDLKTGDWLESTLTVTNAGKTLGKDAKIQIMGAVEAEGALDVGNLRGNGASVTLPVKIKFKDPGEVPVIVKAKASRVLDGKEYTWESTFQFMVKAPEAEKSETIAKFSRELAAEPSKCAICMGNVKPGMKIIKCSCGRTTHEPCGTRAGKCPGCETSFSSNVMSTEQVEKELFDGDSKPAPKAPVQTPSPSQPVPSPIAPAPHPEATSQPAQAQGASAEAPKKKRLALKLR